MILHLVFCELKPGADAATLESLVRNSRSLLLKIPEVLSVRSGRNVDEDDPWPFFYSVEVESLDKLAIVLDDPHHHKFIETCIRPTTTARRTATFELDPSKPLRYS